MEQVLYACLILLALGMSLRMSLRLMYGARGPSPGDPVYQLMNVICWVLTILPLVCFTAVATNVFSVLILSIVAFAAVELVLAWRAMQRRSVWALVRGLLGKSLPTTLALESHQGRFTGKVGRAYRKLVRELEQGADLPTAIADNRSALPRDAQAFASINAIAGAEPHVAGAANDDQDQLADKMKTTTGQHIYQRAVYLISVVFIMVAVVTFIAIKIIPSYEAIFYDFDLDLPPMTLYLIRFFNLFDDPAFAAVSALLLLGVIGATFVTGLLYLADYEVLRPFSDQLFFSTHRSLVLDLLAIAAERGQPFVDVIKQLTLGKPRYPCELMRRRLRRVGRAMLAGQDWKEALRQGSIVRRAEIPMLDTAQQAGNLPWVLRTISKQKVRSMIFRWSAIEQVAFPLVILFVGMIVAFICVGLFIPLVQLIIGLTP